MKSKFLFLITGSFLSIIFSFNFLGTNITKATDFVLEDKDYKQYVKSVCKSALDYDLNMPVSVASDYFDKNMKCFFDSSVYEYSETLKSEFQPRFKAVRSGFKFLTWNKNPDSCSVKIDEEDGDWGLKVLDVKKVLSQQSAQSAPKFCKTGGSNGSINNQYSACNVSQAAMLELCAYREYLSFKAYHDSQITAVNNTAVVFENLEKNLEENNDRINFEFEQSQITVENAIEGYQNFESNYRLHLWVRVVIETLKKTQERLNIINDGVRYWPVKFNNSASFF